MMLGGYKIGNIKICDDTFLFCSFDKKGNVTFMYNSTSLGIGTINRLSSLNEGFFLKS